MEPHIAPPQFPDVMQEKCILYVHGFGSSARSGSVERLQGVFPRARVVAFDLPVEPHAALALLHEKCGELQPDLIVGTSMGGMYAEQLRGYDRILVNPAFEIADTMREHNLMGKQTFFAERADGVQEFYIDKPLVKAYREVSEQCFGEPLETERVWGLFADQDPLVDTFDLFCRHYTQALHFHGGHRLDDHSLLHAVVPVVRWIDDRQQHRQRPIVFVDFDAMHDAYGKPLSSLNKTIGRLIGAYQVYFTAPCPTNGRNELAGVVDWLGQHVGVPAHDHVVFTNQPHLLYGDYFVRRCRPDAPGQKEEELMGAVVELGSDEFKTWEDILTFFDRLGGQ